jgi:hypothetical protein
MAGRGRFALIGAAVVAAVLLVSFHVPDREVACFNEYREKGSPLTRYCDGEVGPDPALLALALVAAVIAAVSALVRNLSVLAVATLVALGCAVAARPEVPTGVYATEGPGPSENLLPPPEPVIKKPPPPGANGLPPDQAAAGYLQSDVEAVSQYVGLCIKGGERPEDCADPSIRNDNFNIRGQVEVKVADRNRWRVVGRTRGVQPVHTYSVEVDLRRGRSVHRCSPTGLVICDDGRAVFSERESPAVPQLVNP